jgi:ABC-type transporter Mla MlaB component
VPPCRPPPEPAVFAIGPLVDRADIPALCETLAAMLQGSGAAAVSCDVGAVTAADAVTVEALARLKLTAQRLGCELTVGRASERLRALIAFAGLAGVLPATRRVSFEVRRQAEEREEAIGVEERVEPPDLPG